MRLSRGIFLWTGGFRKTYRIGLLGNKRSIGPGYFQRHRWGRNGKRRTSRSNIRGLRLWTLWKRGNLGSTYRRGRLRLR
jgi:hypothetical protein